MGSLVRKKITQPKLRSDPELGGERKKASRSSHRCYAPRKEKKRHLFYTLINEFSSVERERACYLPFFSPFF